MMITVTPSPLCALSSLSGCHFNGLTMQEVSGLLVQARYVIRQVILGEFYREG